ncbi:MAG: hypothetical protein KGQ49_00245 [Verrucomicrobia bacterium]|nr:hypothetical protein [Verrucomicrobiota bacterium]MBU6445809.1 hypothetical protein [Verrucomicrobiota bacterium]MDE3048180.1 hypothetical protein [Verrucomicrobiota bacterium]
MTPLGSWDHSHQEVGSARQTAAKVGMVAGAIIFKILKFIFTFEFLRKPFSACCASEDRETLKTGYKQAVQNAMSRCRLPAKFEANTDFDRAIQAFSRELPVLSQDPEKLRAKIVELSQRSDYDPKSEDAAVAFLQKCGHSLESIEMPNSLAAYGAAKIGLEMATAGSMTHDTYAQRLRQGRQSFAYDRDGRLATAIWGADHPQRAWHAATSELTPLKYDSYQNHMVFHADPLDDNGCTIIHKYSPGLTGPRSMVSDVLLPHYAKEDRRWVHIDNQSVHKADEKQRINRVHEWSQQHANFKHAVLSTDTLDRVNQDLIRQFESGQIPREQFVQDYVQALRGDRDAQVREYDQCHGIHIPHELLNDKELEAAFQAATHMTLGAAENIPTKDFVHLLRRNILSTLSWAIMKKEQYQTGKQQPSIFTMSCKENIDRGPQENDDMLFNDDLYQGKTLTIEQAQIRAGINLGRADKAMDRAPLKERMDPMLTRWQHLPRDVARQELQTLATLLRGAPTETTTHRESIRHS